jgi:hypothetical protein
MAIEEPVCSSMFLSSDQIPSTQIEALLNQANIYTMATMENGHLYKFYFYCKTVPAANPILVELNADMSVRELAVTIKAEEQLLCREFLTYVKIALQPILI